MMHREPRPRPTSSQARLRAEIVALIVSLVVIVAWLVARPTGQGRVATSVVPAVVPPPAPSTSEHVRTYAPTVDRVAPTVVTIRAERTLRVPPQLPPFFNDPQFREFFGDRFGPGGQQPMPRQRGLGSGVLVTADGRILTNHHVIDGADRIQVELADRRTFEAKTIGSDAPTDLAVLDIDAGDLPAVSFGDSEAVRVGDVVLALGNPMGVGQTVTMGIISAKDRATGLGDGSFEDFLQTDAPINQGNSGGALVNTAGQLIGINSQILSPSGGNIGIGFAIPVNMARAVMDALVRDGVVRRGRLGVAIQPLTYDLARSLQLETVSGALVSSVEADGPAGAAGLRRSDVIVAVDGTRVADANELRNLIAARGPGAKVELTIIRDGRTQQVTATLDELPSQSAPRGSMGPGEGTSGLTVERLPAERARGLGIPAGSGLLVTRVDPQGAAANAGIMPGDVIQQVDGKPVGAAGELRMALAAGDRPALVLLRRGEQSLFVTLPRTG